MTCFDLAHSLSVNVHFANIPSSPKKCLINIHEPSLWGIHVLIRKWSVSVFSHLLIGLSVLVWYFIALSYRNPICLSHPQKSAEFLHQNDAIQDIRARNSSLNKHSSFCDNVDQVEFVSRILCLFYSSTSMKIDNDFQFKHIYIPRSKSWNPIHLL